MSSEESEPVEALQSSLAKAAAAGSGLVSNSGQSSSSKPSGSRNSLAADRGGGKARAWFSAYGPRCKCPNGSTTSTPSGPSRPPASGPALEDDDPLKGFELSFLSLSGVDDTVSPRTLCDISQEFSFVEWGVNFRAEKQGREPRYASLAWLRQLQEEIDRRQQTGKFAPIHFAAHLGGEYCVDVLKGDASLVRTLWEDYGFLRVYLCPTRANGVNSSQLKKYLQSLRSVILALPQVEFVLLVTKETRALTFHLMNDCQPNLAFFYFSEEAEAGTSESSDKSRVQSTAPTNGQSSRAKRPAPCPHPGIHCGYGGGLTSENLTAELRNIARAVGPPKRTVWVDLESGLRSRAAGRPDEFDLGKAWACIRAVYDLELPRPRPTFASR
ncbi:unnamed protein product [Symbiodinium microadriaticum]|nr:unnamed protein product [Symbiodinium microadriaticum]